MFENFTKSLRKLFSPSDEYGWERARDLGVDKTLNQSGDNTFKAFMDGSYKAQWQMKEKGVGNKADANEVTRAAAKQYLAADMNDRELRDATDEDYRAAMSGQKTKNYVPLSVYLEKHDQYDRKRGTYSTTGLLANTRPSKDVRVIQQLLNKHHVTDKNGESLKEDGIWGPKTYSAVSRSEGLIDSKNPSSEGNGKALSKGLNLSDWGFDSYESPMEKAHTPKPVQRQTTPAHKGSSPDISQWSFDGVPSRLSRQGELAKEAITAREERKRNASSALDFVLNSDQRSKLSRYNEEALDFFTPEQIKRIQDGENFSRVMSELSPEEQNQIKTMGSEVLNSLSPKQQGELMFLGSTALSGIDMNKRKTILNYLKRNNGKITFDDLVDIGVYHEDDRAKNTWDRFRQKVDYGGGPINFPAILEGEYQLRHKRVELICPALVKFTPLRFVDFARRQPCCNLPHHKNKNFPAGRVAEF